MYMECNYMSLTCTDMSLTCMHMYTVIKGNVNAYYCWGETGEQVQ